MSVVYKTILIVFAVLFCVGCGGGITSNVPDSAGRYIMDKPLAYTTEIEYIVYLPDDYGKDPDKQWPLVMFLHGVGERGSDIDRVEATGLPELAANGKKFDFVLIVPQCPAGQFWPHLCEPLLALVDDAQGKWNIDSNRLYLTGLSMGGFGSWHLGCHSPETFAAIAPICGAGPNWMAAALKDVPVWAFHGEKDNVVPASGTLEMIKAIKNAGGNPKVTIYPELGHDSWTATYNDPELYKWMLAQKKQ